jgi:Catalytic LigB subunit of aromatic ring-opening dioxygenase
MARIVVGIGTSHTPLLTIPPELWAQYAENDKHNAELTFPPDGVVLSYEEALSNHVPETIRTRKGDEATFKEQFARCQVALDNLAETLRAAQPDITVVISDDQDEWFYDTNMPSLAVFWGSSVPLIPREVPADAPAWAQYRGAGYGDVPLEVRVPSGFGRHVVEHLMAQDFDVAQLTDVQDQYGGRVARRYPTPTGELDVVRETKPRRQGLPHGFSFVVKRLFANEPSPILPVFQNTCYPPNQVRPSRSYDFGVALGRAIADWEHDARVAVIASGGLSHFVVDEELDRSLLEAIAAKDEKTLRNLPRHRLYSAASESLNWVAAAGALATTELSAELLDYVPVYRTEAGTGGGWAFVRWQ